MQKLIKQTAQRSTWESHVAGMHCFGVVQLQCRRFGGQSGVETHERVAQRPFDLFELLHCLLLSSNRVLVIRFFRSCRMFFQKLPDLLAA